MLREIALRTVWAMLAECAPDHTVEEKLHHYWVRYNGKTYRSLPLGRRGARRPMVQAFHIRKMVTHLAIDRNCADRYLS